MDGEDEQAIKNAMDALTQTSHRLAELLYQQQQAGGQAGAGAQSSDASAGANNPDQDDDVVDAEYTEQK